MRVGVSEVPASKMPGLATMEDRISAFKAFDTNGSGTITIDEVMRIMCRENEHGTQFSIAEAKEHIDEFDANNDHEWSLDEFLTFCEGTNDHGHGHDTMVHKALTGHPEKMLRLGLADYDDIVAAFEAFDRDRDGRVTQAEIIKVMCRETEYGAQFTLAEAKEHLDEFDSNGDGTWSMEEFVDFCAGTNDHGHGHDTMVAAALVGGQPPEPEMFRLEDLRAALALFDSTGAGRLPASEVLSILTIARGREASPLALKDGWKIIERCSVRDPTTGKRVVPCEALCQLLRTG